MMAARLRSRKVVSKESFAAPTQSKARGISAQRKAELDRYFHGLKALEDFTSGKISSLPSKILANDFMRILKASSFLLLYNYIEGCVLEAFMGIYEEIKDTGTTYAELRVEFQKIWVDHQTKPLLLDTSASHDSYKVVATRIIDSIIKENCIELTRKAIPISGNLNEKKIKSVCDLHGIKLSSKLIRVEDNLEVVMNLRNDLAHGAISFGECGRDYVVSDLERIKANSLQYIDLFLNGIESFASAKRYIGSKA